MAIGRTRQLSISPGMSPEMLRLISEQRGINKEFDRRKPVTSPTVFNNDASRPVARDNPGRIIFVRQADSSLQGQYSDGTTWQTFLATAISFATPSVAFGTNYAAGSATTVIRSDATLKYPIALMSAANASTLTLTDDATDQTLTGSLGVLNIVPGTGININFPASTDALLNIRPNTTTAAPILVIVSGRPTAGTRTLMTPQWFSPASVDAFTSQTFRCWDATFSSFAGQHTSSTFVGYDGSSMTITPSASSGAGNKAYGIRAPTPVIGGSTSATWSEIATGYFAGPRRVIISPTVTVSAGIITEPAVIGGTKQVGVLIRQATAAQTATDRIGMEIEAQNSGTNRLAIKALTDASWLGPIWQDDNAKHILGTGRDAEVYYDGTDLVIDPDVVGTGVLDLRGGFKVDSITNDTGLAHGVYTPTRSAEANMDANVTMTEAQYCRVGNTVTVSGRFTADPTLTATATSFEITLPIASNIGATEDAAGTACCGTIAGMSAEIIGVVANDTAKVQWVASDITSKVWSYTFGYQVI